MKTILYVYGTLRSGGDENLSIVRGRLYDFGPYPGLDLSCPEEDKIDVIVERIESDRPLVAFDLYEGYDEHRPEHSLYLRRPYKDGWLYEYNNISRHPNAVLVESGDWLKHCSFNDKGKLYGRLSG